MRILFDNGTPRGLAKFLLGHEVEEARSRGWEELVNGKLLAAAEEAGFDAILTNDKNIPSQQNLTGRTIAVLALQNSQWPMVKLVAKDIAAVVDSAKPDEYTEIPVPFHNRPR